MARNRFTNPANGSFYDWPRNHSNEEAMGKVRNITRTAPTSNVGLVKQQGEDGPLTIKLSGFIVHRSQLQAFWTWFELCRYQTIHFRDFDNQQYEVQIISFQPKRVRKHSTLSPDAGMPYNYFTYDMEMEIYRVISGDLAGVAP